MTHAAYVASPPAKPLMIYDGDCNFCKFWIIRWQQATRGRVEYRASQDARVAAQFPEVPREQFQGAVQFIETDGRVSSGAEAVFRALSYSRFWGWTLWVYQNVPGVKAVTEPAYAFVAKRREGFSFLTRVLWGREGAMPGYALTGWVFLRLMGVVYLSAFVSLGTQVEGLMGSDGILPAKQYMAGARSQLDQMGVGLDQYRMLPTLCWFSASDGFLRFLCLAGSVLSLLVIFNFAPAACLFLLWIIYLSLVSVGGGFLSFQWDMLLLEAGFLAIFFAPWRIFPGHAGAAFRPGGTMSCSGETLNSSCANPGGKMPPSTAGGTPAATSLACASDRGSSRIALWLLRWLLFRLMFESGLVKLLSGDANWRNLTALNFHYETQPLPTWIAWYAQKLPGGFQRASVTVMFVIELAAPFLIFAPRRLRFIGCGLLVFLQLCIALTGNYCFFNLVTVALCVLLLDDGFFWRFLPRKMRGIYDLRFTIYEPEVVSSHSIGGSNVVGEGTGLEGITVPAGPGPEWQGNGGGWRIWVMVPVAIVILMITVTQVLGMLGLGREWSGPVNAVDAWVSPFRSVNTYGLFAVMTTSRREIVIEGSNDGKTWLAYDFKYKPGDLKQRPKFVAPHQPRLDWQMWFAALGTYEQNRWLVNFCVRLLQGSPQVLALLAHDPFPKAPPKYLRAEVYDYHFSNWRERRAEGVWWTRKAEGEYLPVISLKAGE